MCCISTPQAVSTSSGQEFLLKLAAHSATFDPAIVRLIFDILNIPRSNLLAKSVQEKK
jgi:hypothetical protein